MAQRRRMGETRRRLVVQFVALGAGIGLAFPLVAMLFTEPKSTLALVVFVLLCVAAGVGVGFACASLASRAAERSLGGILGDAASRHGLSVNSHGDWDDLQSEVGRLVGDLMALVARVQSVNSQIRTLTAEVLTATEQQASGAAQQAAAVTQTSATVEELAQTSKQIAENSQSVAVVAERTLASAEEGMQSVADTARRHRGDPRRAPSASDRILALGERSQEIGRVLVIIDDIAEQTKILALNAAIEAARAGEAGKGFAVVAEEIRKLADSVTESTSEIGRVVREIQSSASSLVMSTEKRPEEGRRGQGARPTDGRCRSTGSSRRSRRRPTRRSRSRSRPSSSGPPPTRWSSRCARWRRSLSSRPSLPADTVDDRRAQRARGLPIGPVT